MKKNSKIRVMVFGTFDILHKGHLNFFQQAKKLSTNPYLIVSVARDANVKKIKGKKPLYSEKIRLRAVKNHEAVNKAVLGAKTDYIGHILAQKPNIIALGYDQKAYTRHLHGLLKNRGLSLKIKRLKPFKPQIYKTSIFMKKVV